MEGLRGVNDIIRCHAVVQPASGSRIADGFTHGHCESDNVVLHAGFQFLDADDIDFGANPNRGGGILRDLARFGKCFGGCQLDFQPLCELVRVTPNLPHLLAGITWDQFFLLNRRTKNVGIYLPVPHPMIPQLENGSLNGYGPTECPKLGWAMAEASSCEHRSEKKCWLRYRVALPCIASARKTEMDCGGMENLREQAAGKVLPTDCRRKETIDQGTFEVGTAFGRDRWGVESRANAMK